MTNDDFEVVAFGLALGTPDKIRDELGETIADYLRPASRQEIAAGLARLKLVTASANISQDDLALQIAAYADSLHNRPGFAVLWALRNWREKFFPCLYDLEKLIEEKSRYVETLSASLHVKQIARDTRQQWQKDRDERAKTPPASPEHVAEVMARYRNGLVKPNEETPQAFVDAKKERDSGWPNDFPPPGEPSP